MRVFLSLLLEADVEELRHVICNVLTKHYTSLHESSRNKLHHLADEMYAAFLISKSVQMSPSFNNIIEEFTAALSFMSNISDIEQHCAKFLSILTKIGGQCARVSHALQKDWIKNSRTECGVELQPGMAFNLYAQKNCDGEIKMSTLLAHSLKYKSPYWLGNVLMLL